MLPVVALLVLGVVPLARRAGAQPPPGPLALVVALPGEGLPVLPVAVLPKPVKLLAARVTPHLAGPLVGLKVVPVIPAPHRAGPLVVLTESLVLTRVVLVGLMVVLAIPAPHRPGPLVALIPLVLLVRLAVKVEGRLLVVPLPGARLLREPRPAVVVHPVAHRVAGLKAAAPVVAAG